MTGSGRDTKGDIRCLHETPEVFDSGEIILRIQRPATLIQPDDIPNHAQAETA